MPNQKKNKSVQRALWNCIPIPCRRFTDKIIVHMLCVLIKLNASSYSLSGCSANTFIFVIQFRFGHLNRSSAKRHAFIRWYFVVFDNDESEKRAKHIMVHDECSAFLLYTLSYSVITRCIYDIVSIIHNTTQPAQHIQSAHARTHNGTTKNSQRKGIEKKNVDFGFNSVLLFLCVCVWIFEKFWVRLRLTSVYPFFKWGKNPIYYIHNDAPIFN